MRSSPFRFLSTISFPFTTTATNVQRARTLLRFASVGAVLLSVTAACSGDDPTLVRPGTGGTGTGGSGVGGAGSGSAPATGGAGSGGVSTGGVSTGGITNTGGIGGFVETVDCTGDFPMEAVDGVQHAISVPGQSLGDLPHFWDTFGTGHLGLVLREDRGWGELLKKHLIDGVQNLGLKRVRQHGLFHDDIGIYTEVDGQPVYTWDKSDEIFDFLTENGIAPIIELAPMPSALASDPSYTVFDWNMIVSPPKDYALWQELVFQFVSHSIERYGEEVVNNWYFEVWNEPECCQNKFWGGSLQEYHELYDHSAEGVRRALPTGRVGGPVSSQPVELQDNSMSGKLFLDHVTTDNYVNPGQPGVLGFFTFHTWSFVGGAVDGYFQGIDLLNSYQLNDVQIAVTEFGPTWEFGLFDEPQEMSQGAAFAAQVYADISQRAARNGIRFPIAYSWWVLDDVFEEGLYREDDPFIGCMGLTSREDIHKPAYNTYKFLAQMGHQQLVLDGDPEGHVSGMATADDNAGVQVLIYNGQNPGMGPSDDKYYDVTEEHSVGLTVSGLNPEITYDVTAYRVDETHGNAYATWQTLGRPSMSAMTEADWQSLRDTMDSQPEVLAQAVCGSTFSHQFNLASPGVYFLTFTPSVAP